MRGKREDTQVKYYEIISHIGNKPARRRISVSCGPPIECCVSRTARSNSITSKRKFIAAWPTNVRGVVKLCQLHELKLSARALSYTTVVSFFRHVLSLHRLILSYIAMVCKTAVLLLSFDVHILT